MKKFLFVLFLAGLFAGFASGDELSDITGSTLSAEMHAGVIGNFSMAALLCGIIFSGIGVFAFLYGKKKANAPYIIIGILLLVYSFVVQDTLMIIVIGGVLSSGLYFFRRK